METFITQLFLYHLITPDEECSNVRLSELNLMFEHSLASCDNVHKGGIKSPRSTTLSSSSRKYKRNMWCVAVSAWIWAALASVELAYITPHSHSSKACKNRHFHCVHHKRKHVKIHNFENIQKEDTVPVWNTDLMLRVTPAVWTYWLHSRLICEWLLVDAFLPWTDPPWGIYKVFSVDE